MNLTFGYFICEMRNEKWEKCEMSLCGDNILCILNALNIADAYFGIEFKQYQRGNFQENMPKPEEGRPCLTHYSTEI